MKLYKYLMLMGLLGIAAAGANAGPIGTDPGVILRGDGLSEKVGQTFNGGFQTTAFDKFRCSSAGDGSNTNCFENITATYIALHLFFAPNTLSFGCGDNGPDPFFNSCSASNNEVTFSCGDYEGDCGGIPNSKHFLLGLVTMDGGTTPDLTDTNITYKAVADLAVGSTPEPASALLFVIAMGAIALFLKRA
jgi:hypothetical protein